MASVSSVPGFLPSTNGLHFANRFAAGPLLHLGPFSTNLFGLADASGGLCGGMSWYVRERFQAGQPIPPDTLAPADGSPLFNTLLNRQLRSLEWFRTPVIFWWSGAFGVDRTAERTRNREWPRMADTVTDGRLAMVGLVRQQGLDPRALQQSHQVLGYGVDTTGDTRTLRIYDSNWPDKDDVTIVLTPNTIRQSTGETLYGLLSLD
jgi:hypothetical protein